MTKSNYHPGQGGSAESSTTNTQRAVNFEPPKDELTTSVQGLCDLAADLELRGDLLQAEEMFRRAVTQSERFYGPSHGKTADALEHLLSNLKKQLAGRGSPAAGEPSVADGFHEMAVYYHGQGQYLECVHLYRRAIALAGEALCLGGSAPVSNSLKSVLDTVVQEGFSRDDSIEHHPVTADTLTNLTELNRVKGKRKEAETLHQRALHLRLSSLGDEHPDIAENLDSLGCIAFEQGRYGKAESFYLQSLAVREPSLGAEHPDAAVSLSNLGHCLLKLGRYAEAERHLSGALGNLRKTLGNNSLDVADCLKHLGQLHCRLGNYPESETFHQEALGIVQSRGDAHSLADNLNKLAELYRRQGRYTDSELLSHKALSLLNADKYVATDQSEAPPPVPQQRNATPPAPQQWTAPPPDPQQWTAPPPDPQQWTAPPPDPQQWTAAPLSQVDLSLSDTDLQIIRHLSQGQANSELSKSLSMPPDMVRSLACELMKKLSHQSAEAAAGSLRSYLSP